jgi:hypothetical protein
LLKGISTKIPTPLNDQPKSNEEKKEFLVNSKKSQSIELIL